MEWRSVPFTEIPAGQGRILQDPGCNGCVAILTIGPVGNAAAKAAARATEKGIQVMHCDMRFLKPIDRTIMEEVCSKAYRIITVEDGTLTGGLYDAVTEYLNGRKCCIPVKGLGIPDRFIEHGNVHELHRICRIDEESILNALME